MRAGVRNVQCNTTIVDLPRVRRASRLPIAPARASAQESASAAGGRHPELQRVRLEGPDGDFKRSEAEDDVRYRRWVAWVEERWRIERHALAPPSSSASTSLLCSVHAPSPPCGGGWRGGMGAVLVPDLRSFYHHHTLRLGNTQAGRTIQRPLHMRPASRLPPTSPLARRASAWQKRRCRWRQRMMLLVCCFLLSDYHPYLRNTFASRLQCACCTELLLSMLIAPRLPPSPFYPSLPTCSHQQHRPLPRGILPQAHTGTAMSTAMHTQHALHT